MNDITRFKNKDELFNNVKKILKIDDEKLMNLFSKNNIDLGDIVELSFLLKNNPESRYKTIIKKFFKNEIIEENEEQKLTPMQAKQHIDKLKMLSNTPNNKINVEDKTGTKTVTQSLVGVVQDDQTKKDQAVVKDPLTKKVDVVDISQIKEIE